MAIKTVVVLLVSLVLASVHLAHAQEPPKKPLIGVLVAGSPSSMESRINSFQKRLRELGYKEGSYTQPVHNVGSRERLELHLALNSQGSLSLISSRLSR